MKRIYLTAATARFIEYQISQYEDARDEKGKPQREARERRQWAKIADEFVTAAGECDTQCEALKAQGAEWGKEILAERGKALEHLSTWHKDGVAPEHVQQTVQAVQQAFQLRIDAKENELNLAIQHIEDGPLGQVKVEVDVDDAQVDFLTKTFSELDLNTTNRRLRRLIAHATAALENPVKLVKSPDGNYVPEAKEKEAV